MLAMRALLSRLLAPSAALAGIVGAILAGATLGAAAPAGAILAASSDAPAADPSVAPSTHLELPSYQVSADDQFRWSIPIKVVNATAGGIYNDSLQVVIEDLDPGQRQRGRKQTITITKVAESVFSLSAGDSAIFKYTGVALAEHARVSFHLYSHSADGKRFECEGTMEVYPGGVSRQFPSRFLRDKKRLVEYVIVPEVWPPRRSPALLILHGEDGHARQLLRLAWDLANHGYTSMLVSLPGYGQSSGPPDFGGPATLKALRRALDLLRHAQNVDSTRIAVWGVSQGATVAALLAAERKDLKAVVLQSGIYDLTAAYRGTTSEEFRRILEAEAGPRGAGWRRRSPLGLSARLSAPVLLLHGEHDPVSPAAQANEFAASLRSAGRSVSLQIFPEAGHFIPMIEARKAAHEFLKPYLTPESKGGE